MHSSAALLHVRQCRRGKNSRQINDLRKIPLHVNCTVVHVAGGLSWRRGGDSNPRTYWLQPAPILASSSFPFPACEKHVNLPDTLAVSVRDYTPSIPGGNHAKTRAHHARRGTQRLRRPGHQFQPEIRGREGQPAKAPRGSRPGQRRMC